MMMKTLEELFEASPKGAELISLINYPSDLTFNELLKSYATAIEFYNNSGKIIITMKAGNHMIEKELSYGIYPTQKDYNTLASGLLTRLLEEKYGLR